MSGSEGSARALPLPSSQHDEQTEQKAKIVPQGNYKGFVAGVFSGIAKLTGVLIVQS